jgi:large subunit ribosomal protein L21e
MVVKSHGPHRRTREKFRGPSKLTPNLFVREFPEGTAVALDIRSNSPKGQPFRRFQGLTGKIIGRRGRAYIVAVKDGNKLKAIIASPEHLKAV